jgi:large subunit ribosomal protein L15
MMRLNDLAPEIGAKKAPKRLGRGIGSNLGKTSGKGHKGQKSRSGGYHKVGFEGGQMPLQRRMPKVGFTSLKGLKATDIRLDALNHIEGETIDVATLKAAGVIAGKFDFVKVVASGSITKAVTLVGIKATAAAAAAIEAAGGKLLDAKSTKIKESVKRAARKAKVA